MTVQWVCTALSWLGTAAGQQFIQNAIAMLAIVLAARGVRNWNIERRDLRRAQLAEESLVAAYKVRDAITEIRNPFSFGSEGSSRQREDGETDDQRRERDLAYVPFERINRFTDLFDEIHRLRYNVSAAFGTEAAESFNELLAIRQEIFVAARNRYAIVAGRDRRPFRADVEEGWQNVIWEGAAEPDPIDERLDVTIAQLEQQFRPYMEARFRRPWRLTG